jgi:hypothetical protein
MDADQFKAKNDVVYAMQRCVGRWEPGRVQQAQLTVEALFCLQSIVVFFDRDVAIALWWFAVLTLELVTTAFGRTKKKKKTTKQGVFFVGFLCYICTPQ